jgi:hypothetical protein
MHPRWNVLIQYKKRKLYKYTLFRPIEYDTGMKVVEAGQWGPLGITEDGVLTIQQGYTWDGPSGPTFDTKTFMRGALIHDALYQLMREGKIGQHHRQEADQILYETCLQDGMNRIRAKWVHWAVKNFARRAAQHDLLTAP